MAGPKRGSNGCGKAMRNPSSRLLDRSVVVLVATAAALVLIVVLILPRITFSFAPQSDNGSITVNVSMHNGTTLAATNATTGALEKYLLQQPAVKTVQTIVGSVGIFTVGVNRPENTTMVVQLVPLAHRAGVYDLMDKYRKEHGRHPVPATDPSATLSLSAGGGPPGSNSTISLSLLSSDQDLLQARSKKILQFVKNHAFVTGRHLQHLQRHHRARLHAQRIQDGGHGDQPGRGGKPAPDLHIRDTFRRRADRRAELSHHGPDRSHLSLGRTVSPEPARLLADAESQAAGGPAGQPRRAPVSHQRHAIQPPVHGDAVDQPDEERPLSAHLPEHADRGADQAGSPGQHRHHRLGRGVRGGASGPTRWPPRA